MPRNVSCEVELAEGHVRTVGISAETADVRTHLERVRAFDHAEGVEKLERAAVVDCFAAGRIAQSHKALDVDLRESVFKLLQRAAVRTTHLQTGNTQILFRREIRTSAGAQPLLRTPHVAEPELV